MRVAPRLFVFGDVGQIHNLQPSAFQPIVDSTTQFTYSAGTLPGDTPAPGDDVTQQLTSLGDFTQPAATIAFMLALGGGVAVPVAHHLSVDVGYRYARIAAETPLSTQGATFGFGYRF